MTVILLLIFFLSIAETANAADSYYFEMDQFNSLLGRTKIIANKDAIKIEIQAQNSVLVSKAPKWEICLYSPKTKRYCVSSLSTWHPHQARLTVFFGDYIRRKKWVKTNVKNLQFDQLRFKNVGPDKQEDVLQILPDSIVGKEPSLIYSRYCGWNSSSAAFSGIPTKLFYRDKKKGMIKVIETYSMRRIKASGKIFECPESYKRVEKEQFVMNHNNNDALEIMLGREK